MAPQGNLGEVEDQKIGPQKILQGTLQTDKTSFKMRKNLGGGFKYLFFLPILWEMIQFD